MMKNLKNFILLFFLAISFSNYAQENKTIDLSITVKDENKQPVAGAVILIDNVKQRRVANLQGVFKIKLKKTPKEITVFSALHGVKNITYRGENQLDVILGKGNGPKQVIGADINTKSEGAIQFRNIYDYLRGKVAGVTVSTNNRISIRGASNWSGSNPPLLVLNGVQVDDDTFGDIVPTTIRSIKVLKGPETSIYGLRGANGGIEVTTAL